MAKISTLVFFIIIGLKVYAQQSKEEILLAKLASETADSSKAYIYMDLHNEVYKTSLDKAKEYANGILKYALLAHNWHMVEVGYLGLARCERKSRNYNAVIPYDFKALEFARKLDNLNQIFVCTSQIANDYMDAEKNEEAVKYMFMAKNLADKTKNPASIGKAYETIGYYYYQQNQPTQAIGYLRNAVNECLKGLDLYRANRSRTWLGFCMMQLHQTKGLPEMIFETLDYYKKANVVTSQAECYRLLGFCNLSSGDFSRALVNYNIARKIYHDTGNLIDGALVNLDLAKNYIQLKDFENAKQYITEAELVFVNNKYASGTIACKTVWGEYYTAKKQYNMADKFFIEADKQLKKAPNETLLIENETYWAQNTYQQKSIKKGDSLIYSYTKRMAYGQDPALISHALTAIRHNYQQIDSIAFGDLKTLFTKGGAGRLRKKYPYKNLKQILPVIDSLADLNSGNKLNFKQDSAADAVFNNHLLELETRYRTRIKNDSLRLERQNALIVKDDLKVKDNWLVGSSAFVLLLAGGFMVQRKYRRRAEADKKRIEVLKNEIHHRIKNNLSVINRLVDVAEKACITTIPAVSLKNRVNAIGLLHQHLYQNQLIDEVDMQDYLTGLTNAVKDTFETGKAVTVEVNAPVMLSGSAAENIGLLVNELVTNSYKYAFVNSNSGLIKIGAKRSINGSYKLCVSDNGAGINMQNSINNYGMKLIAGLCYEVGGTFSFKNDNGTKFELTFTDILNK